MLIKLIPGSEHAAELLVLVDADVTRFVGIGLQLKYKSTGGPRCSWSFLSEISLIRDQKFVSFQRTSSVGLFSCGFVIRGQKLEERIYRE